jgi:uncharacterized protein YjbI with pentapeptide repeats
LAFTSSSDFAFDKAAGEPCSNLLSDFRCSIHEDLPANGFRGCAVYDCFGSGQQVSQITYGGTDWRHDPGTAQQMFRVFPIMRNLHELLWHLDAALTLAQKLADPALVRELRSAFERTTTVVGGTPDELLRVDIGAQRSAVDPLLNLTSQRVRAGARSGPPPRGAKPRADLIGARLAEADLSGIDLHGAYLIGADLRAADLRLADLRGADLRAADVRSADLSSALFLSQFQLNAHWAETGTPEGRRLG